MPTASTPNLRVVLADDHELMRTLVRAALEDGGFDVVAEAGDADGAVGAALDHRPDACVLDLRMPGGGADAARRIDNALPGTPIVMLSASSSDADMLCCLGAGALGYLVKGTELERLPGSLRRMLADEGAVPRSVVARLTRELDRPPPDPGRRRRLDLSDPEREVLGHLRHDRRAREIAQELGVPAADVRRHIASMARKLGARGPAV